MKQHEITAISTSEIIDKIAEEKQALAKLKINHAVSPIENPMKIRDVRKTIARLSTEVVKRNKAEKK